MSTTTKTDKRKSDGHYHSELFRRWDCLITPDQAAEMLGVTVGTLRTRAARGIGPRRVRFSERRVMYWLSEVEAYAAATNTDHN